MTKLQRYDLDNVNLSLEGFNTMVPDYMGALCWYADVSALEAENERLRNDNAVLRDLAAAANPPKLSPEQLQRLRDLEQEKQ